MEYPEGATPLESEELEGLKLKHVTTRSQLDHLEQANIEEGLIWLSRNKTTNILNEEFIKTLHLQMFGQVWRWAGYFRKTEKNIGVDPLYIAVEIRKLLDDVKYWIDNNTYSTTEIAIRFHHRLLYIHPFPNGNGRHARIMADTLLIRTWGALPIDWAKDYSLIALSIRRTEYIAALRQADTGNMTPLLEFVAD